VSHSKGDETVLTVLGVPSSETVVDAVPSCRGGIFDAVVEDGRMLIGVFGRRVVDGSDCPLNRYGSRRGILRRV